MVARFCSNPPRTASRSAVIHFWAAGPRQFLRVAAGPWSITEQDGTRREFEAEGDPFRELQKLLARYRPAPSAKVAALAPFTGGAVGFLGYDAVRFFEGTVPPASAGRTRPARDLVSHHGYAPDFRSPLPASARAGERLHGGPRPRRGLRRCASKKPRGSCAVCARRATCGRAWFTRNCPPRPPPPATPRAPSTRPPSNVARNTSVPGIFSSSCPRNAFETLLRGRCALALPRVAVHQPVAVHVPVAFRQPVFARGQFAGGPCPRAGWLRGNPAHRRHPPSRRDPRGRPATRGIAAR